MRLITDELYAEVMGYLAKDERVQLFSRLLMCQQVPDSQAADADADAAQNEEAANGNDE